MSSDDNAPVRITNRELYDLLQENLTLSRETRQIVEALTDKQQDHETRIRAVERLVWQASGVAAVLGVVGGALVGRLFG